MGEEESKRLTDMMIQSEKQGETYHALNCIHEISMGMKMTKADRREFVKSGIVNRGEMAVALLVDSGKRNHREVWKLGGGKGGESIGWSVYFFFCS